ncbi:MAG: DUF2244 domain-containing protein [Candidatus Thiothrix putei]|uniref:DUF2244 domain-containing protein n=1 Tax=Candidatus Thiothrix putei TaxID=3080811 RepID=A0AA95HDC0_9GAMM|nr:MAG: DUF2244 domain-containing protein [Candidatus Thiothrix putei]
MVTTTSNLTAGCRTFEVRPNRSLSREGMMVLFAAVAVLTLLVAARFILLGAWLVLPFALLEIVVLGVSLYLFERASRYSETIQIAPDGILIITRNGVKTLREYRFQPYWVKIALQLDPRDWYPSKLLLRSHGESIEIGACLTNADRKMLAKTITTAIESCRKTD